jgi:hypothetical protein
MVYKNMKLTIGSKRTVGKFFWVKDEDCIGFDKDAYHGHGLDYGGSVDKGDVVEILGHEPDGMVVVKVYKDTKNLYGALCPHGMVFLMKESQILSWPPDPTEGRRQKLAFKYKVDIL